MIVGALSALHMIYTVAVLTLVVCGAIMGVIEVPVLDAQQTSGGAAAAAGSLRGVVRTLAVTL